MIGDMVKVRTMDTVTARVGDRVGDTGTDTVTGAGEQGRGRTDAAMDAVTVTGTVMVTDPSPECGRAASHHGGPLLRAFFPCGARYGVSRVLGFGKRHGKRRARHAPPGATSSGWVGDVFTPSPGEWAGGGHTFRKTKTPRSGEDHPWREGTNTWRAGRDSNPKPSDP